MVRSAMPTELKILSIMSSVSDRGNSAKKKSSPGARVHAECSFCPKSPAPVEAQPIRSSATTGTGR